MQPFLTASFTQASFNWLHNWRWNVGFVSLSCLAVTCIRLTCIVQGWRFRWAQVLLPGGIGLAPIRQ